MNGEGRLRRGIDVREQQVDAGSFQFDLRTLLAAIGGLAAWLGLMHWFGAGILILVPLVAAHLALILEIAGDRG